MALFPHYGMKKNYVLNTKGRPFSMHARIFLTYCLPFSRYNLPMSFYSRLLVVQLYTSSLYHPCSRLKLQDQGLLKLEARAPLQVVQFARPCARYGNGEWVYESCANYRVLWFSYRVHKKEWLDD